MRRNTINVSLVASIRILL